MTHKSYQLLAIKTKHLDNIIHIFKTNNLKFKALNDLQNRLSFITIYLVDAPEKLALGLKNETGYELYSFSNEEFISLSNYFIESGFIMKDIEFLGEHYFEDWLIEELNNTKNNHDLLSLIKERSLRATKFTVNKEQNITFYRSGLIFTDLTIEQLSDLLDMNKMECLSNSLTDKRCTVC